MSAPLHLSTEANVAEEPLEHAPLARDAAPDGAWSLGEHQDRAWSVDEESCTPCRTWTINGRFLTQRTTGVQRYGQEIVHALDELLSDRHPATVDLSLELLVPGNGPVPSLKSISVRRTRSLPGHLWEQLMLPAVARGGILSLCNTSTILRRKQIVCVHDLNFLAFPGSYSFAFRSLYRLVIPQVLRVSSGIATVSQYSADELARAGFATRSKVRIAPNGHEHVKRWRETCRAGSDDRVDRNTIVVIGSSALHKNVDVILGLAGELALHGLRVAVVGGRDAKVFRRYEESLDSEAITWLGYVPDEQLAALYQNCLCLAFPSRAEGFGLPPLEAMALGCPVVSSSATSLPEVCGNAALYAAPDNAEAWLRAFLLVRSDNSLRAHLIENGLRRAAQFSWRATAESYLQTMLRIDRAQNAGRRAVDLGIGVTRLGRY